MLKLTKTCTKCDIEKDIKEFYKNSKSKDGLRSCCISCVKLYYKKSHEEKIKERDKNKIKPSNEDNKICTCCGIEKNKDLFLNRGGKHKHLLRSQCRECESKRSKNNRIKNIDQRKEYRKRKHLENRELEILQSKIWKKNNIDHIRNYSRQYASKRIKNDIEYKIKKTLRSRVLNSIKKEHKKSSALELLGCTIEQCRMYLESKFLEGMNWDNHGLYGWHIDHIIPCASFDLTDIEEQKKCFHYTNLQPLWARDNLIKNKYCS